MNPFRCLARLLFGKPTPPVERPPVRPWDARYRFQFYRPVRK